MGPPPFGDGNKEVDKYAAELATSLQWGHRLSAMEMAAKAVADKAAAELQWGHRLSAMEI